MREHRVIFNEGVQTLRTIPQGQLGRATRLSSAVYTIIDLRVAVDDTEHIIQAEAPAVIDAVNTTTTAIAGPTQADPDEIVLTSVAGVSEDTPYIISDSGDRELVRVRAINGLTVKLEFDLSREYSSGAAFQGVEVTGTFPAAEANDEEEFEDGGGPYYVRWEWTIDGVLHVIPEPIFIVRYVEDLPATREDLLRIAPNLESYLGDTNTIVNYITQASNRWFAELRMGGRDQRNYKTGIIGKQAVSHLAVWYALIDQGDQHIERAQLYRDEYEQIRNSIQQGKTPQGTVTIEQEQETAPRDEDRPTVAIFERS